MDGRRQNISIYPSFAKEHELRKFMKMGLNKSTSQPFAVFALKRNILRLVKMLNRLVARTAQGIQLVVNLT